MAQLVASMSGVVLGGVVEVVDSLYPYIYIYIYLKIKSSICIKNGKYILPTEIT